MLKILVLRAVILAAAIALTSALLPDVSVSGGPFTYLWIAVLLALVNATLGVVVRILTLPLRIITLGLISLVVNGFLLWVVDRITDRLDIDGLLTTIIAALVIAVVNAVLLALVPERD